MALAYTRSGMPKCVKCGKQVRVRRGYCRSCGEAFMPTWAIILCAIAPGVAMLGPVGLLLFLGALAAAAIGFSVYVVLKAFGAGIGSLRIGSRVHSVSFSIRKGLIRLGNYLSWAASGQWVARLPVWAQPIIWGIGVAIPCVLLLVLARRFS
jgi:hypothetical protein